MIKSKKNVFKCIYSAVLIVLLVYRFTTWSALPIKLEDATVVQFLYLWMIILVVKLQSESAWDTKSMILAGVLCIPLMVSGFSYNFVYLVEYAILIIGARNVSSEKIIKIYLIVVATMLALTMYLAVSGEIVNFVAERYGRNRNSFGINSPTDFGAHVFFLYCAYIWLREKEASYWDSLIGILLAIFIEYFCVARTNAGLLVLLAGYVAYVRYRRIHSGTHFEVSSIWKWICVWCSLLLAAVSIGLSYFYNPENQIMALLNRIITDRFLWGKVTFDNYKITLWGQYITEVGLGGYFIDSSYMRVLFRWGVLLLVGFIVSWVYMTRREAKNKAWIRMGVFAIIAVQFFAEHHVFEIVYNPFFLLLFADSAIAKEEG